MEKLLDLHVERDGFSHPATCHPLRHLAPLRIPRPKFSHPATCHRRAPRSPHRPRDVRSARRHSINSRSSSFASSSCAWNASTNHRGAALRSFARDRSFVAGGHSARRSAAPAGCWPSPASCSLGDAGASCMPHYRYRPTRGVTGYINHELATRESSRRRTRGRGVQPWRGAGSTLDGAAPARRSTGADAATVPR